MSSGKKLFTRFLVNGPLVIPDSMPDITKLHRLTSTPVINKNITINGAAIFEGEVIIHFDYVSASGTQSSVMHNAPFRVPFAHLFSSERIRQHMDVGITVSVDFQEAKRLNTRTIAYSAVVMIRIHKTKRLKHIDEVKPSESKLVSNEETSFPSSFGTIKRRMPMVRRMWNGRVTY